MAFARSRSARILGVFQFGQDVALLHPLRLDDPQLDDHAADLRADEDLMGGNDVALRLQGEAARGSGWAAATLPPGFGAGAFGAAAGDGRVPCIADRSRR